MADFSEIAFQRLQQIAVAPPCNTLAMKAPPGASTSEATLIGGRPAAIIASWHDRLSVRPSEVLAPGGAFIAKVLQGGATGDLLKTLKRDFAEVRHVKPPSSRKDLAEIYVVALGFRGSH